LRAEKRSYLEYQKAASELERLTRLVKAYEWTVAVDKTEKAKENLARAQRKVQECKEEIERGGKECEGMESEIKEIQKRRERVRWPIESLGTELTVRNWQKAERCRL
jgi:structural maintenance of chromosome 2